MSMLDSDQPMPVVMRSRCVNCSLLIPRNHPQHSLQQASTTMITILQSWITPTELSSESVLCTDCMVILQDQASTFIDGYAILLPAFGHRSLCFSCGKSILCKTRTHAVRSDRQEMNIILRKVLLHLVSRLERVWNACWLAAYREMINQDNPHLNRFPRLSINDLKRFALGTYQLKQARSYYGEHVCQTGTYYVEVNNEVEDDIPLILGYNNYLLRGRIKSRHVNSRTYFTYLLISKDDAVADTFDAIVGYSCSCLVGKRTVGCCAHIMTIVWFLSWGRYNDITAPASYLDNYFDEYEE